MSTELATHLTGRHILIPLLPFSFAEVLRAMSGGVLTTSEQKSRLASYVREGGFPEPLIKGVDRDDYLRTMAHAVLYKDIVKRHRIRAIQGLEDLSRFLFSNIAKEYSFQSLSRVTRCRSVTTAEKYVRHLEEAFLVFSICRFSFKVREQAAYNKKVYCVDNGLAVAMGFRFSEDRGRLYENLVAIALWKRMLRHSAEIYFWKNTQNEEVDFVIKEGLSITTLIQVCQRMDDTRTLDREVRALVKAGQELKCEELLVLNEERESEESVEWFGIKGMVKFVPLWKWLAEQG